MPDNVKKLEGIRFVRGAGATLFDESGNGYLDFTCSYGPILLGHADARVNAAVAEQMARGVLFPYAPPCVDSLQEALVSFFPHADGCLFFKTGSEAVSAAIRLARAFTGRDRIVRSGFTGWHDASIAPHRKWHDHDHDAGAQPFERVPGVPAAVAQDVWPWDGCDLDALFDMARQDRRGVAAIVIDPVQLREPLQASAMACLQAARRLGALLIFDETKTSLRLGLGGAQALLGVAADLTVVGKALGNGFPLSAVLAAEPVLRHTAECRIKGTYNGEACSIAAALATLDVLRSAPDFAGRLAGLGTRMIEGFNRVAAAVGVSFAVKAMPYRWPAMPHVDFISGDRLAAAELSRRFSHALLERRMVWLPNHMNYLSLSHTAADVDAWLAACRDALAAGELADALRRVSA
ncbi:aminotransferase class III-fold pyridoxal phosphate-dependent enzyme [Variovorax sp. PBL-E5]|uniref:aminotransferase class III-fold pyridoxal phosphate-dependent enzyme n=1 Tax=Variovorax sp. PBL-E5 TaxID=434014 RepID=UPI00131604EC|nr:aminotransferase class III-fold pyridoxal phosphate-dependent enzyme [Variovorax sp. PBL-E5]VTU36460.1 Glutamate-1-semialdehyde 2,1-aminomutase [Variovorax sp. PBL-E5]